jgi:hypothetical protein
MAVSIKSDIFWYVTYSLVEVYRCLGEMYCLHFQGLIVTVLFNSQFTLFPAYLFGVFLNFEDGDIMLLRNVNKLPADNRGSQPSRQYST